MLRSKDMSDYKVPYTKILSVTNHANADRLDVVTVYGFQVIVSKDKYKVGDLAIYVPIDSLLPQWLEERLFPADSKIKLNNHRVRQIKIRKLASQGMLIDPIDIVDKTGTKVTLEDDLAEKLGITKYEPPHVGFAQTQGTSKNRNKKTDHPLFHKYNGLDNIKWFPDLFQEDEMVVIEEKMHGTNARASLLPYNANTIWKKIKKFFHLNKGIERCYGSNNVDISSKTIYTGFYGEDVYGSTFRKMDVFSKLFVGETVFGEIIGPGIQKGYTYGLKEHLFVVFDVKILQPNGRQKWLTPHEVALFCAERGFKMVPVLYTGRYNKEEAYALTKGNSAWDSSQKVREGIVIKAMNDYDREGNKRALKWVSEDYLDDKNNTDFH